MRKLPNSGNTYLKFELLKIAANPQLRKRINLHEVRSKIAPHTSWLGDPFEDEILDGDAIQDRTPIG